MICHLHDKGVEETRNVSYFIKDFFLNLKISINLNTIHLEEMPISLDLAKVNKYKTINKMLFPN